MWPRASGQALPGVCPFWLSWGDRLADLIAATRALAAVLRHRVRQTVPGTRATVTVLRGRWAERDVALRLVVG